MEIHFSSLDARDLDAMYKKKSEEVRFLLLGGAAWDDIKDSIDFLTEISKELARRHTTADSGRRINSDTGATAGDPAS
jgi:hypothetical protein